MTDLITAGKLCKEEREKRGLSLQDVHNVTKIPVDIIRRLEEDENYLTKDPYARFLMKVLVDFYQLDLQLTTTPSQEKKNKIQEGDRERQGFFMRFLKAVFTAVAGFFVVDTAVQENTERVPNIEQLVDIQIHHKEKLLKPANSMEQKREVSTIILTAFDHVWLTAYVDGKEKVLNLKKGQKVKLPFKNKIKFETIGNADNLVIIYDRKKVAFERKIIHNLFVDGEGVFFNGYNLTKEES